MNNSFEIPKDARLSIYVTHGSVTVSSAIARQFHAKEPEIQVFVLYDNSGDYILQTRRCSAIVNQRLIKEFSLEELPEKHSFSNLDEFIHFVQRLGAPVYRVCCDANLTLRAGHVVSYEAHLLLKKSRPYQVIFIHSTPECVENAVYYLRGGVRVVDDTVRTRHLLQLPLSVKEGGIFDRRNNFLNLIETEQHKHPTWTEGRAKTVATDIICRNIYCFSMFKKMKAKIPSVKFDMRSSCTSVGETAFATASDSVRSIKKRDSDVSETQDASFTFVFLNKGKVSPRDSLEGEFSLEAKANLPVHIKPTSEPDDDESVVNDACCVVS